MFVQDPETCFFNVDFIIFLSVNNVNFLILSKVWNDFFIIFKGLKIK